MLLENTSSDGILVYGACMDIAIKISMQFSFAVYAFPSEHYNDHIVYIHLTKPLVDVFVDIYNTLIKKLNS